jgi:hypothetical protein
MHAAQRLARDKSGQGFQAKRKLPDRKSSFPAEFAFAQPL